MRNSKGDNERTDNFKEKGFDRLIMDSYCVSIPRTTNSRGFKCECDDSFASVIDSEGNQECIPYPKDLQWDLNPKESSDKSISLPHFAHAFYDPSYYLKSSGARVSCETSLPEEFFHRPLDICGVYNVDYILDERARKILDEYLQKYPNLKSNPKFQKDITMIRNRKVTIYPINRCSDNIPSHVNGHAIDSKRASHDCHDYANCKNNWSHQDKLWETLKTPDSCGVTCSCFEGYYPQDNTFYKFVGDGKRKCEYKCIPKIHFEKGSWVRIKNQQKYEEILQMELDEPINVLMGEDQCYVCKRRISGNNTLDQKTLVDHTASCSTPTLKRREDGSLEITGTTASIVNTFQITHVEIDLEHLDNEFLHTILPKQIIEVVGNKNGKPFVQIYVVKYEAESKEGVKSVKKRIVFSPIVDISDDIEKIRIAHYWLKMVYWGVLTLAAILFVYLFINNFGRFYACFQYFILSNRDRNIARLAWDTVYFLRHPLNTQARNQLVYQALYMD